LWRGLAEMAQKYLHKGSHVFIEGRIKYRTWEDKEGSRKMATDIVGENIIILDKKEDATKDFGNDYTENKLTGNHE
jgi:single-strand DNA-binding protein